LRMHPRRHDMEGTHDLRGSRLQGDILVTLPVFSTIPVTLFKVLRRSGWCPDDGYLIRLLRHYRGFTRDDASTPSGPGETFLSYSALASPLPATRTGNPC